MTDKAPTVSHRFAQTLPALARWHLASPLLRQAQERKRRQGGVTPVHAPEACHLRQQDESGEVALRPRSSPSAGECLAMQQAASETWMYGDPRKAFDLKEPSRSGGTPVMVSCGLAHLVVVPGRLDVMEEGPARAVRLTLCAV